MRESQLLGLLPREPVFVHLYGDQRFCSPWQVQTHVRWDYLLLQPMEKRQRGGYEVLEPDILVKLVRCGSVQSSSPEE